MRYFRFKYVKAHFGVLIQDEMVPRVVIEDYWTDLSDHERRPGLDVEYNSELIDPTFNQSYNYKPWPRD